MTIRGFTNVAPPQVLAGAFDNDDVTITVASTAGYPATPFTLVIDRGLPAEEFMLCTAKTGTTFTVTRGYDGSTGVAHTNGTSIVEHAVGAIDYREANAVANALMAGAVGNASKFPKVNATADGYDFVTRTMRVVWTYTLPGDIKVPSGQTDFLPYVPISVPSGQTVTLIGYEWYLSSGTSFTFSMKHKTGSTLATNTDLVTGVVAASASVKGSGTFGTPKVCADHDFWLPVITAISATPNGGSVAITADVSF